MKNFSLVMSLVKLDSRKIIAQGYPMILLYFKKDRKNSDYTLGYSTHLEYEVTPHNVEQFHWAKQLNRESFIRNNYYLPSQTQDIIILQERSGFFLGRKGAHENLSNSSIQYSIHGLPSLKSGLYNKSWSVIVALKMKF